MIEINKKCNTGIPMHLFQDNLIHVINQSCSIETTENPALVRSCSGIMCGCEIA